jgi:hypothetical protein
MYNTREALAYSGKLPVQQNPTGVTPQLLDLLAMQKVDADKKAAAQALAMSSGQANMPTVAQSIEQQALNSARGEIAQKLGLAGLMQQQAPQMPQMPAQGIASASSPLPQTYQGGGIVAFASRGEVPEAEEDVYSPEGILVSGPGLDRVGAEDMTLMERLGIFNRENRKANERADAAAVARTQPAAPREVPAAARRDDRAPLPSLRTPPAAAPAGGGLDAAAKADFSALAKTLGGGRGAPVMSPENIAFIQAQKDRIASEQKLDPEKFAADERARRDETVGKNELAAIENQKLRTAGLQALYERQAAERPSNFIRGLQLIGKNPRALPGQEFEGVSEGIDKTNAGYTTQDIANRVAINTLNEAMEKAIRENDIGGYNAALLGLEKARIRIAKAGEQGTTMADVLERTQTQKETNYQTTETRRQEAMLRMREMTTAAANRLVDKKDAAARQAFEADQKQAMALATSAATKLMEMPANMAKYKNVPIEAVIAPLYQDFLTQLTAKPGAPRAPAATSTQRTIDFRTGKPI